MIDPKKQAFVRCAPLMLSTGLYLGLLPSAAAIAAAAPESSPITSSQMPYSTACLESKNRSRSLSSRTRSAAGPCTWT